jgi:hypothetical protein
MHCIRVIAGASINALRLPITPNAEDNQKAVVLLSAWAPKVAVPDKVWHANFQLSMAFAMAIRAEWSARRA